MNEYIIFIEAHLGEERSEEQLGVVCIQAKATQRIEKLKPHLFNIPSSFELAFSGSSLSKVTRWGPSC